MRYYGIFRYRIVFVPGFYVGFYVLWSARGVLWSAQGNNGRRRVEMVPVMLTGFSQFLSDLVETWPVRGGRCSGRRGVVGNRRRSLWAEHCPEMVFWFRIMLFQYGMVFVPGSPM